MKSELERIFDQGGPQALNALSMEDKLRTAGDFMAHVIRTATGPIVLCWTGGKDSTLILWFTRKACLEQGLPMPSLLFIDELNVFPETRAFQYQVCKLWNLELEIICNESLAAQNPECGKVIPLANLDDHNRNALQEAGHCGAELIFEPDSPVCNHLLKTVPLRRFILERKPEGVITALRWDEHPARADETPVSPRTAPPHVRLHPLLHFTERDIWGAIHKHDVPYCDLYRQGYRSLGAKSATAPVEPGVPAWEQDLDHTRERQGRGSEKEQAMEQLRSLGYM